MRRLAFVLALVALQACSWKRHIKDLSDEEFDHYYALRVFMTEDQQKEYLKLPTEEERDAWLKQHGLWDRFYQYEPHIREKIVAGDVQEGWTKDMVYMAWGAPLDRRKLPGRKAERSEMLIYRFEEQPDGTILVWTPDSKTAYKAVGFFEKEVILDDDVVAEIRRKDASW